MNVYGRILIIVFIAALAAPGYSQEDVRHISMEKAVELSLQASEDYQIAANEVDRRNEQYKQARAGIYPQVEAGVTWRIILNIRNP